MSMGGSAIGATAVLDIRPFIDALGSLLSTTQATAAGISKSLQGIETSAVSAFTRTGSESKKAAAGVSADWSVLTKVERDILATQTAFNGLFRAATQLSSVGQTLLFMGAGVLGVAVAAEKAAEGFDFWTRRVQASIQVANSFAAASQQITVSLQDIKKVAETISINVGVFDPSQVAQSIYLWTSAMGDAITSATELARVGADVQHVLQAAAIAGVNSDTAIRGVAAALREFGLSSDYASHVTDILLNITQKTGAEFEDVISAFKMVGPVAHDMGLSIEEVTGIFGMLGDVNLRGTQAGRALQQLLTSFVDPSKKAQGALVELLDKTLGVAGGWQQALFPGGQFIGLMDEMKDGSQQTGAITMIADAVKGLSQAQADQLLKQLESQNAFRALAALVTVRLDQMKEEDVLQQRVNQAQDEFNKGLDGSTEKLQKAKQALDDFRKGTGAGLIQDLSSAVEQQKLFNQQWDAISNSIKVQFGSAMNSLKASFMDLGTITSAALLPMLKQVTDIANGFRQWALENPKTAQTIVQLAVQAGVLITALGAIGFALGQVLQVFIQFRAISASLTAFIGLFLELGPTITGVGTAIAALVAGIVILAAQGGAAWQKFITDMNQGLGAAGEVLKANLRVIEQLVNDFVNGNWADAWSNLKDIMLTNIALAVTEIPKLLGDFINAFNEGVGQVFGKEAENFATWGENLMVSLANGIIQGAEDVISAAEQVAQSIANLFESHSPPKHGPLKGIQKWGENLMGSLGDGVEDGSDNPADKAGDAAEKVGNAIVGQDDKKSGKVKAYAAGGTIDEPVVGTGQQSGDTYVLGEAGKPETIEPSATVDTGGFSEAGRAAGDAFVSGFDSELQQLNKADFSSLNELVDQIKSTIEASQREAFASLLQSNEAAYSQADAAGRQAIKNQEATAKEGYATALAEDTQKAREDIVAAIADLNSKAKGLADSFQINFADISGSLAQFKQALESSLDTGPLEKLSQMAPQAAQDLKELLSAMADVSGLQQIKQVADDALQAAQDKLAQARQVVSDLQTAFQEISDTGHASSAPAGYDLSDIENLQGKKSDLQGQKQSNQDDIDKLNDQKQLNSDLIDQDRDRIDKINEQKAALQGIIDGYRDQIDALQESEKPLDDQIKALNDQKGLYDDQLKAIKDKYDAERQADEAKSGGIQEQIDQQKLLNDQVELGIKQQIASLEESGGSPAQVANLQKQLQLVQQRHQVDAQGLQIQKEQQDLQNKQNEDQRKVKEASEENPIEAQKQAADNQIRVLNQQKENTEKQVDVINQQIKAQEKSEKSLDKQVKVQEDAIKGIEAQDKAIDRQIRADEEKNKAIDKQVQGIDKQIKADEDALLRRARADERSAQLGVDEARRRDDAIAKELKAAQDKLAIEQDITKEHLKRAQEEAAAADARIAAARAEADRNAKNTGLPGGTVGLGDTPGSLVNPADAAAQTAAEANALAVQAGIGSKGTPNGDRNDNRNPILDSLDATKLKIEKWFEDQKSAISGYFSHLFDGVSAAVLSGPINGIIEQLKRIWVDHLGEMFDDLKSGNLGKFFKDFGKSFEETWTVLKPYVGGFFDHLGTEIHDKLAETIAKNFGLDGVANFQKFTDTLGHLSESVGIFFSRLGDGRGLVDSFNAALNNFLTKTLGPDAVQTFSKIGSVLSEFGTGLHGLADAAQVILPPLLAIFGDVMIIAIASFGEAFRQIGEKLEEHGPKIAHALEVLRPIIDFLVSVLGGLLVAIITTFVDGIINLIEGIGGIVEGFEQLADAIQHGDLAGALTALKNIVGSVVQTIIGILQAGLLGDVLGIFSGVGTRIIAITDSAFGTLVGLFRALGGRAGSAVEAGWDALITVLSVVLARIPPPIGLLIADIVDLFGSLVVLVGQSFGLLGNSIVGIIQAFGPAVLVVVSTFIQNFINFFTHLYDVLVGHSIVPDLVNAIIEWFQKMAKDVLEGIGHFKDSVIQFFGTIKDKTLEIITGMVKDFKQKAGDLMEGFLKGITDFWTQTIQPWFEDLFSQIAKAMESQVKVGEALLQMGKDLIDGLWSGISDFWSNTVVPFFQGLWNAIIGLLPNPEKVLDSIGQQIIQGLQSGAQTAWDGFTGWLTDKINHIGDSLPHPDLTAIFTGGGQKGSSSAGGGSLTDAQFGTIVRGMGFTEDEIASICGPIAAAGVAKAFGEAVDLKGLVKQAEAKGFFNPSVGTYGNSGESGILGLLGIGSQSVGQNQAMKDLSNGTPIIINTPKHFFLGQGINGDGTIDTGETGKVFSGGNRNLTLDQITRLGGGLNGFLEPLAQKGGDALSALGDHLTSIGQKAVDFFTGTQKGAEDTADNMKTNIGDRTGSTASMSEAALAALAEKSGMTLTEAREQAHQFGVTVEQYLGGSSETATNQAKTAFASADDAAQMLADKFGISFDAAKQIILDHGEISHQVLAEDVPGHFSVTDDAVEKFADQFHITWDQARALLNEGGTTSQLVMGADGMIPTAAGDTVDSLGNVKDAHEALTDPIKSVQDASQLLVSQGFNPQKDSTDRAKDSATQISFVLQQLNDKMPSLIQHIKDFISSINNIHDKTVTITTVHKDVYQSSGQHHSGGYAEDPNAPKRPFKFHDGGLAIDEIPAILQKGELVLSRQQVNRLFSLYGGGFLSTLMAGAAGAGNALRGLAGMSSAATAAAAQAGGSGSSGVMIVQEGDFNVIVQGSMINNDRDYKWLEDKLERYRIARNAARGRRTAFTTG